MLTFALFHFRYSFSLSAGLLAAISPRCYSFLALSRFSFLSFPRAFSESRSSLISVSLLLATSLILFSVLLAPLSSPSLPFRLLVYTLVTRALSPPFSFSLFLSLRKGLFSLLLARAPVLFLFFHVPPLRRDSSVYCVRVFLLSFSLFPFLSFSPSFPVSLSFSLSHSRFRLVPPACTFRPMSSGISLLLLRPPGRLPLSHGPKVYSLGAGPVKNLAALSASKRGRSESRHGCIGKIIYRISRPYILAR